ncbi:MAG: LysR family transcriptional regulator [Rhizomicrobium sp.]
MRGSEFAELKAFAAIVERASFARAAEHLGLSASALSQTIRQLETRLGVQLLNRTTRSVAPTQQGGRLYERVAPIIRDMDAAVEEAMSAAGRVAGTLRINAPGMAVKKLIAPRLGRFHRMHPDVVLDVAVDDGLSDIVAGHFDAGIRVGERLEKDMIAVRLTSDVADPDRRLSRISGAPWRAEDPGRPASPRRHQLALSGQRHDPPLALPEERQGVGNRRRGSADHELAGTRTGRRAAGSGHPLCL